MSAPILLATWSFSRRCIEAAWPALSAGGDGMDAVELACRLAEDDPRIDSVGFGGLPDRDGAMSLDGCVMRGPRASGAVSALRHCRHPVSVARRVMERTPHLMLAGDGADRFAAEEGFPPDELLAPDAAMAWVRWKADGASGAPPQGVDSALMRPLDDGAVEGGDADGRLFAAPTDTTDGRAAIDAEARWRHHDTIGVLALAQDGTLTGACSTSGTPFKRRGRVGDSPIIGHGLYVDPGVGAAVATGTGELVMGVCGTFLAIELLRQGATAEEAVGAVLRRIVESGPLEEAHQVGLIVLARAGGWSTGAIRDGYRTSIIDADGARVVAPATVLLPSTVQ